MGFSKTFERVLSPVVDSVRQVPIMAWVPLTIVWFGIGDGPTIFLIAFSGSSYNFKYYSRSKSNIKGLL